MKRRREKEERMMRVRKLGRSAVLGMAFAGFLLASCSRESSQQDIGKEPSEKADAGPLRCPEKLPGPRLVAIPAADGSTFCIDQREVLYREYADFLAAKGDDLAGQPDRCAENKSFTPYIPPDDQDYGLVFYCRSSEWQIDTAPESPVGCVDFCDALAYCTWAGKRLCGRVGGGAGIQQVSAAQQDEYISSSENEWYYTCSNGGTTTYPFGDEYQADRCAAFGTISGTDLSTRECHGTARPYDQVYDLSGSTGEWINICEQGSCMLAAQGGADVAETYDCAAAGYTTIWRTHSFIGFRCCADPVR
jgi:formylglycine-generating enzyme